MGIGMTVIIFSNIEYEKYKFKIERVFVNPCIEFCKEKDSFFVKINKVYYQLARYDDYIIDFYSEWKSFVLKRISTTDNSKLYEILSLSVESGSVPLNSFISDEEQ